MGVWGGRGMGNGAFRAHTHTAYFGPNLDFFDVKILCLEGATEIFAIAHPTPPPCLRALMRTSALYCNGLHGNIMRTENQYYFWKPEADYYKRGGVPWQPLT